MASRTRFEALAEPRLRRERRKPNENLNFAVLFASLQEAPELQKSSLKCVSKPPRAIRSNIHRWIAPDIHQPMSIRTLIHLRKISSI